MNLLIKSGVFVLAVFLTDLLLRGIWIKFPDIIVVAIVLGAVNLFVKPIIQAFTLPITMMTLGLFPLVLNVVLVLIIANYFSGFEIYANTWLFTFLWAFVFSILLTIVSVTLSQVRQVLKD